MDINAALNLEDAPVQKDALEVIIAQEQTKPIKGDQNKPLTKAQIKEAKAFFEEEAKEKKEKKTKSTKKKAPKSEVDDSDSEEESEEVEKKKRKKAVKKEEKRGHKSSSVEKLVKKGKKPKHQSSSEEESSEQEEKPAKKSKKSKKRSLQVSSSEEEEDDQPEKKVKVDAADYTGLKVEDLLKIIKAQQDAQVQQMAQQVAQAQQMAQQATQVQSQVHGQPQRARDGNDPCWATGRCPECTTIFKSAPVAEKGTSNISDNKVQVGMIKVKSQWTKKFASIPCKTCLIEVLRRLNILVHQAVKLVKEGRQEFGFDVSGLAGIMEKFAGGRNLVAMADEKCEVVSFEELHDGVHLRICFSSGEFGTASNSCTQHYAYEQGLWRMVGAKQGSMDRKNCGLARLGLMGEKIVKRNPVEVDAPYVCLGQAIADSLAGDFMPPASLKVAKNVMNTDEIDF